MLRGDAGESNIIEPGNIHIDFDVSNKFIYLFKYPRGYQ